MQENLTIARPYAQAAFDVAEASNAVVDWERALRLLATIVADEVSPCTTQMWNG